MRHGKGKRLPEYIEGGNVGYLTWDQFQKFRWAVEYSRKLVPWLRVAGYLKGGEADVRVQSSSDRPLGLPPTWVAAEDISRLLMELNQWHELEDAANDEYGAWLALTVSSEVGGAAARWPFEDRPHAIRHMRCQVCQQMTLRYNPPRHEGDGVEVRCRDRSCGAVLDELMFERVVVMIRAEHEEQERRRREVARARRLGDGVAGDGVDGPVEVDDLSVGGGRQGGDDAADEGAVA